MDASADILTAARHLADMLKDSAIYRDYRRSLLRLEEKPELAYRLRQYKKAQAAYEYKRLHEPSIPFEEEKNISHLYASLMLNEDANRFLACEDAWLSLYSRLFDLLNDACEIELFTE